MYNIKNMKIDYKKKIPFEKRKLETENIMKKYENRLPIIVQLSKKSKLIDLDKKKFLAPTDLPFGQFKYIVRKKVKIEEQDALFYFINNKLCGNSETIGEIYEKEHDNDGYLYIYIDKEATFGF